MNAQFGFALTLMVTLVAQAALPGHRLLIVLGGAALSCAGAAWFEAQLIDFDVYSNQGNWLYLSGCGTDPRGSRRFDPQRQAQLYDPDGAYRARWSQFATEDDQR